MTVTGIGKGTPSRLNTPPLTTMDSEDEFMSGLSDSQEEDFEEQQDSDGDSLEDGA